MSSTSRVGRLRRKLAGMLEIDAVRGGGYRVRLGAEARGRVRETVVPTPGVLRIEARAAVGASDGVDDRQA